MIAFISKRLLQGIFVLLGTSILIFCIARVVPGDVPTIALGARASAEAKEMLRQQMNLDDPLPIQYVKWLGNALHGDLGMSFKTKRPVVDDIIQFFPATLELILVSGTIIVLGTFVLGLLAGRYKNTWVDGLIRIFSYAGIAVPAFVVGILLVFIFAYKIPIIPVLGRLSTGLTIPPHITGLYVVDSLLTGNFQTAWDAFLHLLLPAFALAIGPMVQDARVLRSTLVDNSSKEYMAVSVSYGLPDGLLSRKYLLKPSATAAVTVMGLDFSALLGQAFLVELIFNWPGLSRYGMNAMLYKDLNAIIAVVLIISIIYFFVNLFVDIIVAALDPRVRLGRTE
jgi:peptide/nickel transport system permease protein